MALLSNHEVTAKFEDLVSSVISSLRIYEISASFF